MESLREFIRPELLVLIPVLYIIGVALKTSGSFPDKHIPLALGLIGVALAAVYIASTISFAGAAEVLSAIFMAVTQGVLCAGASVYFNQVIKQEGKDE